MASEVYWIRHNDHTDMTCQGYIGVSVKTNRRLRHHRVRPSNEHLKNAIAKYGWDNLVKEVLLVADDDYCLMIEGKLRPEKSIGWNVAIGGGKPPVNRWNLGKKFSQETLEKMRAIKVGKTLSKETRKRISESNKGRVVSDYTKQQIILANKGRPNLMKGQKFPDVECPHCGKIGRLTGMKSWHFDNCRNKESV